MRDILNVLSDGVCLFLTCLLIAKLAEIAHHLLIGVGIRRPSLGDTILRWNPTVGSFTGQASSTFLEPRDLVELRRFLWPVTASPPIDQSSELRILARRVFRYRYLMFAQGALLLLVRDWFALIPAAVALLAGIWLEIARLMSDRLVLGDADDKFRRYLDQVLDPALRDPPETTSLRRTRRFAMLFAQLVAMTAWAYACIYYAVDALIPIFTGKLSSGVLRVLDFVYFSVVTLATVGYGDISPDGSIARALVGTEIVASFAVVVVFLTSVTLTAGGDRQ